MYGENTYLHGNACARGTCVIALLTETARRGQEEQDDKLSTTQQQDEKTTMRTDGTLIFFIQGENTVR